MEIQKIAHAQQNWEVPVNQNFTVLTADSGIISLPLLAPFEGAISARKVGPTLLLIGDFTATESLSLGNENSVPITKIPTNMLDGLTYNRYFIIMQDGTHGYARLGINVNTGGISLYEAVNDATVYKIRLNQVIETYA